MIQNGLSFGAAHTLLAEAGKIICFSTLFSIDHDRVYLSMIARCIQRMYGNFSLIENHVSQLGLLWLSQRSCIHLPSNTTDESTYETEGFRTILKKDFYDDEKNFCKLCNEEVPDYRQHSMFHVYHMACVQLIHSIFNTQSRVPSMSPRDIVKSWWPKLRDHRGFFRIRELSAESQEVRKKKLFSLLMFMKRQSLLKHTFSCLIQQGLAYVPHRTVEFDRFEWIGDNIMKKLIYERIQVLEKDMKTSYHWLHSFIMGNEPLHDAYDAFSFDKIIQEGIKLGSRVILPVSKMKADIVEALLGELQVNLWATQSDASNDYASCPSDDPATYSTHFLYFHALHETATLLTMEILFRLVDKIWVHVDKFKKKLFEGTPLGGHPLRFAPSATRDRVMNISHSAYKVEGFQCKKRGHNDTILFPYVNMWWGSCFRSSVKLYMKKMRKDNASSLSSCRGGYARSNAVQMPKVGIVKVDEYNIHKKLPMLHQTAYRRENMHCSQAYRLTFENPASLRRKLRCPYLSNEIMRLKPEARNQSWNIKLIAVQQSSAPHREEIFFMQLHRCPKLSF